LKAGYGKRQVNIQINPVLLEAVALESDADCNAFILVCTGCPYLANE